MFKIPNFYMLCIIKLPEWRHRIVIPLPLFLIDEVLSVAYWGLNLGRFSYRSRLGLKNVNVEKIVRSIQFAWRSIRMAGSFTLVEVDLGDGTKINVRLI